MEKLNKENIIKTIKDKIEIERHNLIKECRKKEEDYRKHHEEITDYEELEDYQKLTDKEKLSNKVIFSNEELDFVIKNYRGKFYNNEFLGNCLYLLNEFKQTKQASKCNAVYNILNKYFTIENSYRDIYSYPEDYAEWDGFIITHFIECPTALKEMIKEKVEKIKIEKQKQSRLVYKEKADKTDKEIIAELEL